MSDQVADALGNGADYIEKNGWWRNATVGPNGRQACMVGGLLLGNGYDRVQEGLLRAHPVLAQAVVRLANLIEPAGGFEGAENFVVTSWNDGKSKCRDKQAAIDLMRRAEKIERTGFDPDA
jgi:membrane-bound lytic murein transglycosylase B